MDLTRTFAAIGAAAAMTAMGLAPQTQAQSTTAHAESTETPSMSMGEFRRWQRNWDRRLLDMAQTEAEDYAWGKEKRAIKSQVVVLDPPLERVGPMHKVTVEWFYSPIDERSKIFAPVLAMGTVRRWENSIKEAGEERVQIVSRIVSEGVGVPGRYKEQFRLIQDMLYAWGDNPWRGNGLRVDVGISRTKRNRLTLTESDAEAIIEEAGLDPGIWRAKRELPQTQARRVRADSRYREAMRQAAEQSDNYLATPQDPVLLIDGKFLLTGYVTKRTTNLFRMANRIIRERIEKRPEHALANANIAWGNEHRPKGKQLVTLPGKVTGTGRIEIEWLYTYVDRDGNPVSVEAIDKAFGTWLEGVRAQGIEGVAVTRVPAAWGEGPGAERQRIQQRIILAWADEGPEWRDVLHWTMGRKVAKDPGIAGTDGRALEFVKRSGMPLDHFQARWDTPELDAEVASANEKVQAARAAFEASKRRFDVSDPVLLVNGKYLLEAGTAGGIEKVFQILNWMVRRHFE